MLRNKKNATYLHVKEETDLLTLMMNKMGGMTKTSLKNVLTHKLLLINDTPVSRLDAKLYPNDKITLLPYIRDCKIEYPNLKIVFEDDDFIAIDKPVGLLSVETHKNSKETTAFSVLKKYVREQYIYNNIYIIHRLDKETSGILVFARKKNLQETLRHSWKHLVTKKHYVAIVDGKIKKEGKIVSWLTEDNTTKSVASSPTKNEGKKSITFYRNVATRTINDRIYSYVDIDIETGRTNQIRVQMASIGHPIVGDKKYGHPQTYDIFGRMALHAQSIEFTHPQKLNVLRFEASIPQFFSNFLQESKET